VWAGQLGLRYSFADFINPAGGEIAALYRQQFSESEDMPAPVLSVAVWAICAETTEEAQRLAASARMSFRLLRQGKLIPVPPPEKALHWLEQQSTSPEAPGRDRRAVIGDPDKVREGIEAVARDYGAEEVMVVTITHDHGARRRSYELIADAFGLSSATDSHASATAT
jgi:alkanesulfonate monooxygenase SsuD/methylene tetrahydromethanopterin reductase-like flavin-dependent oxidoreductase (luciferase family)